MGYLAQIRLRTALERLGEPGVDLARLALETGFGSHSHFTDRFRAAFGHAPSAVRDAAAIAELQEASKNLEAGRAGAS